MIPPKLKELKKHLKEEVCIVWEGYYMEFLRIKKVKIEFNRIAVYPYKCNNKLINLGSYEEPDEYEPWYIDEDDNEIKIYNTPEEIENLKIKYL